MKIEIKEKKVVMALYFLTLLSSLMTVVDNVPFTGVLLKVKYLYALAIIFFCLYDGVLIWNRRFYLTIGLLSIHTVLYGLFFVNWVIADSTRVHFEQLITLYIITFFTAMYVYKKKCYLEWLELSCLALGIMTLWCAFTHPGDFVNPIYFVNIFSRTDRYRAAFGMPDVNICGNYCLYFIVLSLFVWEEWKKQSTAKNRYIRMLLVTSDVIVVLMILSTASRSALLSLILFLALYLVLKYKMLLRKHWKLVTAIVSVTGVFALAVFISTGMLNEIWMQSNRDGNISINHPIFIAHGNLLNGMGYMDNSGFLLKSFGYETTAMDIYFLYIYYSTGIIGAVLIFGQMLLLCYWLLRFSKTEGRDLALSLFGMMMFYAIWQVNYMNYRYYTGILHIIILLIFTLRVREERSTYFIQFKRE